MTAGEVLTLSVPSQTDPNLTYKMHVQGGEITCSCWGYRTHSTCKHRDALRRVLEEEQMSENGTTAIVKREEPPAPIVVSDTPTSLLPARGDLEAMALIAGQAVRATGMIPAAIKTKEQALAVILAGWELGLRPMTALRHVYVVNGRTEIETRAMVGIIKARRTDIQFSWPEYTQEAVTCVINRPGQPETRVRYTTADATASGQMAKGGPWKAYTRDMLYAAATKRACRLACPDLINAIETGLQHTVVEATSLLMPDAEVRDVTEETTLLSESIPADAFNEGDEPDESAAEDEPPLMAQDGGAPPAPPPAPPAEKPKPAKVRLARFLGDARRTYDAPSFAKLIAGITASYPGAFSVNGDLMISGKDALTEDEAQRVLDGLAPEPPAGQQEAMPLGG